MKKLVSFIVLAFLTQAAAIAQHPDFSGDWKVNKDKVQWGQAPEWVLPRVLHILQDKDGITLVSTELTEKLDTYPDTSLLQFDGKEFASMTHSGKKQSSWVVWEGNQLVEHISVTTQDGQPWQEVLETWSLSDDGKSLTIKRDVQQKNNNFNYTITGYFDKQ